VGIVIHLDTNLLIDLVTCHSAQVEMVHGWLKNKIPLSASAVTWSEFCNGPHTKEQKDAVHAILRGGIHPFTEDQAEFASRLFHLTGRKRGSHADCMIAAAAFCARQSIATRNIKDFERFLPYGVKLIPVPTLS
jgi:predicted nucleic acid-binding protein